LSLGSAHPFNNARFPAFFEIGHQQDNRETGKRVFIGTPGEWRLMMGRTKSIYPDQGKHADAETDTDDHVQRCYRSQPEGKTRENFIF
jgi:hypothetical protein